MANQAGERAFRSLIENVTRDDPQTKLTPEAITRLTEKLGEIVGYDVGKDFTTKRNERGELVNEEGLPIIDITEPEPPTQPDGSFIPYPEPIVSLQRVSAPVRERLREKRNEILDALEKEEAEEEEQERRREREELQEMAKKREADKERQKTAKELQKKMGKALLRSVAESKEQAAKAQQEQQLKDELEEARRKAASPFKKKNVTFAEEPELFSPEKEQEDWGDLIPGRVQPMKRPTLLTETSEKQTMKMKVVERRPTRTPAPPTPIRRTQDSDDESDDETQKPDGASSPPDSELESDNELDEETDFDYATLQRQVQLEYARMRATIGQDAASLIQSSSEADSNEPQTEDGLGVSKGETSKPAISQYRANRLLSAYGARNASTAAASDFIVPAASARTMQNAIRTGKIDDSGKLVGGEDDSASEAEDEAMQEVLELLKRGEVYNLGPNGEPIYVLPEDNPAGSSSSSTSQAKPSATAKALGLTDESKKLPPLTTKTPMSRFKLSRGGAGAPSSSSSPSASTLGGLTPSDGPLSESATPINEQGRSSPKSNLATPLTGTTAPSTPALAAPPIKGPGASVIVDSPSFPLPRPASIGAATGTRLNPNAPAPSLDHPTFSMIVESPSFPRPGSGGARPAQAQPNAAPMPSGPLPGQVIERKTSRPTRPPTIMTTTVRESKPPQPPAATVVPPNAEDASASESRNQPAKKVSRFKRERTA